MEGYANAGALNGSAGNSALVGGRRRKSHRGSKKLKLRVVNKSTVRRMLAKKGLKMRGGMHGAAAADGAAGADAGAAGTPVTGGRRRKSHRKSRKFLGMF